MTPTLHDIIAGLASGRVTAEQANPLVGQQIVLAVAQGRTRDMFAAAALEDKLASGLRITCKDSVVSECFRYADAMTQPRGAS